MIKAGDKSIIKILFLLFSWTKAKPTIMELISMTKNIGIRVTVKSIPLSPSMLSNIKIEINNKILTERIFLRNNFFILCFLLRNP